MCITQGMTHGIVDIIPFRSYSFKFPWPFTSDWYNGFKAQPLPSLPAQISSYTIPLNYN